MTPRWLTGRVTHPSFWVDIAIAAALVPPPANEPPRAGRDRHDRHPDCVRRHNWVRRPDCVLPAPLSRPVDLQGPRQMDIAELVFLAAIGVVALVLIATA
jgi:hypothetical protein